MAKAVYVWARWADGISARVKVRGPALLPRLLGHQHVTLGKTVHTRVVDMVANPLRHTTALRHEATHVRQYRRYGVIRFLWRYLFGGQRAALEAEAAAAATGDWPFISLLP